jgi:hypothetical protein
LETERNPEEILQEVLGTLVEWHEKSLDTADRIRFVVEHGADFDRTYPVFIYEQLAADFERMIDYITMGTTITEPIAFVRGVGD